MTGIAPIVQCWLKQKNFLVIRQISLHTRLQDLAPPPGTQIFEDLLVRSHFLTSQKVQLTRDKLRHKVRRVELLYKDNYFIAVNKPAGFHVHPHENAQHRVSRDKICLYHARRMMKQHVYPVHRLDAGTSGVLLFALSSESARELCQLFSERVTQKTYRAVVRGYVPENGVIDLPSNWTPPGTLSEAKTSFHRLGTIEFPVAVGKKFPTARYSWVEVTPHTGRIIRSAVTSIASHILY